MIKSATAILAALITLTGCVATMEERIASYSSQCSRMGFEQGTDTHAMCVMLRNREHERRMSDAYETMALTNAQISQGPVGYQYVPSPSFNCTTSTVGGYTNTNCY